jgi:hypothetical protein
VSDIDTATVDSLKALDPNRPIREADIWRPIHTAFGSPFMSPRLSQLRSGVCTEMYGPPPDRKWI